MRRPLDEFVMPVSNTDSNGVHFVPMAYYRLFARRYQDLQSCKKRLGQQGIIHYCHFNYIVSIRDSWRIVKG